MKITMPRGDIRPVRFTVQDNFGEESDLEFEEIYFTVKRKFSDTDYLFQKRLGNGTIIADEAGGYSFVIESADTDNLRVGTYVFDIELVNESRGVKQTTVGELELTNEVTFAVNEV